MGKAEAMTTKEGIKRLAALVVLGSLGWLVSSKAPAEVRDALTSANGAIWALLAYFLQSPIQPTRAVQPCTECGKENE